MAQTMVRQIPLKVHTDSYTYFLLFLLSIVNHHSSWHQSFICGCNANGFMKGIQLGTFYWHSRRFGQGRNQKLYSSVSSVIELLSTCLFFTEGKTYSKLMLGTLFSELRHFNDICREKCSACNDIQK
jgi:hypothetical protein